MERPVFTILTVFIAFTLFAGAVAFAQTGIEQDAIEIARQAQQRFEDTWARRAPGVVPYIAWLSGMAHARATDPVGVVLIVIAFILGLRRSGIWTAFVGASFATLLTLVFVYSWWTKIGVAHKWPSNTLWMLVSFLLVAAPAYGAGRILRHLSPKLSQTP
ncbi:hypothetical protein [Hyphomicrobium sp.]|uniref:hypothetical protein n=1 Tax=Hyphomicrobium sp. TaxID=82 RepID=UPI003F72C245